MTSELTTESTKATTRSVDSLSGRIDNSIASPLHIQIRHLLAEVIDKEFENGETFYKEVDIAQRIGVSRATVRQAIRSLELAGRLIRRKRYGTLVLKESTTFAGLKSVAVFLRTYQSEATNAILDSIDQCCKGFGIGLHAIRLIERDNGLSSLPLLQSKSQEGVICLAVGNVLPEALSEIGYRVVQLCPNDDYQGSRSVVTRNDSAVDLGLNHLLELGHHDIALLVTEPSTNQSVVEKIRAFEIQSNRHGLRGRVIVQRNNRFKESFDAGRETMAMLWKMNTRPTAVFTVSDFGALGAISWCQQHGIKVPDEISVLGFEGIPSGALVYPPLTSVGLDTPALAAAMLNQLRNNDPRNDLVAPRLVLRNSTMAPQQIR